MSDVAHILIVDDEPNVRLMFRTTLEAAGDEVATVADGRAALDHLERGEVVLVLLDLQMPEMTGMETLQRLRDVGNEVAVVIVTAYCSESCTKCGTTGWPPTRPTSPPSTPILSTCPPSCTR